MEHINELIELKNWCSIWISRIKSVWNQLYLFDFQKKRCVTLIRLYWQSGNLDACAQLTCTYLDAMIRRSEPSQPSCDNACQEFGLPATLEDPNPPTEVLIPHHVISPMLATLEEYKAVNPLAIETANEIKSLVARAQGLCARVSKARRERAGLPTLIECSRRG